MRPRTGHHHQRRDEPILRPHPLSWSSACAARHRIQTSLLEPPVWRVQALSALIVACPSIGKRGFWLCKGNGDGRLNVALHAASDAAKQVEADLHARGVLCDAQRRCTVRLLPLCVHDPRCNRVRLRLEICLHEQVHRRARVCEPFGEVWQQAGALPAENSSPCIFFRLDRIAWWWKQLRVRGTSPFLRGSTGPEDDRLLRRLVRAKPLPTEAVRGSGWQLVPIRNRSGHVAYYRWAKPKVSRLPPLTAAQRARQEALWEGHESEVRALLQLTSAALANETALRYDSCAVVGSGHDLKCGEPMGGEIDEGHEAVFRANAAQHVQSGAPGGKGHHLSRGKPADVGAVSRVAAAQFAIGRERAGARTTHRSSCLYTDVPLVTADGFKSAPPPRAVAAGAQLGGHASSLCVISFNWWSQTFGQESYSNQRSLCCDGRPARRSNYTLAALRRHAHRGLRLGLLRGVESHDPILDGMRQSSGGSALHAAVSLCRRAPDVYASGLLAPDGAAGEKVYTHAYDAHVGRCVSPERAAEFMKENVSDFERRRWATKTSWRRQRIGSELMIHVLHALGVVRWRH